MKFTRIAAFLMAAAMATALVSCTKDDDTNNGTEVTGSKTTIVAGLDDNGFIEGTKASEILTLPEYKGITLDKSVTTVTDEALQHEIDLILESNQSYEQLKEGTIEDGTTANIDYVGSVDGVEFSGGSTNGMGTDVTIGVTNYIPGFLDQLIGHKPGENFDINVTFPETYHNTDLAGKDAVFNITINYIQGEPIETELTDEIAKGYGFTDKEALIEDVKAWLLRSQAYDVFTGIVEKVECETIPQAAIDYFKNLNIADYTAYAETNNMSVDEVISMYTGYENLDAFIEANMKNYEDEALKCLTAQAIAELEGLSVTTEDVNKSNYAMYVSTYGEAYIKQLLLIQEVVPAFIVENGKTAE